MASPAFHPQDLRVGIVGAGLIGSGLLALCTEHGIDAVAVDVGDAWSALSGRSIIIEALPEDLAVKRSVLRDVQVRLDPIAVLSTTSSLTAAALGEGLRSPARITLWHPFTPVGKRRLVEIARPRADLDVDASTALAAAHALASATDRIVLDTYDSPGLLVNRILKRWTHAGLRALDEGWSPVAVDEAFVAAGFRLGPAAVVRLVGPSVSLAVSLNLEAALGERFAPPAVLRAAASNVGALDAAGRTDAAGVIVESAMDEVRDEIARVLVEGLVPQGSQALVMALREGAGWPAEVVASLHAW